MDEYTPGDFLEDWDIAGLFTALEQAYPVQVSEQGLNPDQIDREELKRVLVEDALSAYDEREAQVGPELMRWLERYLVLETIDLRWREHLYDMDYLREGIHLRGFAQIDPLVAYKNEAFTLFSDLMHTIWADFTRMVFNVEISVEPDGDGGGPPQRQRRSGSSTGAGNVSYSGGGPIGSSEGIARALGGAAGAGAEPVTGNGQLAEAEEAVPVQQRRLADSDQTGRNDPCWCGSGKKFKKCHGA